MVWFRPFWSRKSLALWRIRVPLYWYPTDITFVSMEWIHPSPPPTRITSRTFDRKMFSSSLSENWRLLGASFLNWSSGHLLRPYITFPTRLLGLPSVTSKDKQNFEINEKSLVVGVQNQSYLEHWCCRILMNKSKYRSREVVTVRYLKTMRNSRTLRSLRTIWKTPHNVGKLAIQEDKHSYR